MTLEFHYPFMYFPQSVETKSTTANGISRFIGGRIENVIHNLNLNYDGENKTAKVVVKGRASGCVLTVLHFRWMGSLRWCYVSSSPNE